MNEMSECWLEFLCICDTAILYISLESQNYWQAEVDFVFNLIYSNKVGLGDQKIGSA